MTAPPDATPAAPAHRDPAVHPATPGQLHWLEGELRHWRLEGLVDDETASAIRGRYVASRRFTLSRIVLTLGAGFVGLGLIWLVAANLDEMSPLLRFGLMLLVWLGLVAAAELLADRRGPRRRGDRCAPRGVRVARPGHPVARARCGARARGTLRRRPAVCLGRGRG